ncbi:GNAT family N-acetyltransferase [Olivibacter sp. SDN3]|uniref:GNAT family N-acetyltransferase n=1 Tax=Olivibacter sp. SDN3 TaxID=2764720 RepID=UPI0016511977|nr:GNAT family N-acetyltransferase [Olivibacter sp. SDN3]QNL48244.1 GNAT family N-acetyltransferase [Olivibacter sp. SDN3]
MPTVSVNIVDFTPSHQSAFKSLNEQWITKHFRLETADIEPLNHPESILNAGGFILVALLEKEVIGVCALKKLTKKRYELSKFAVDETKQGLGVGKALLSASIAKAKAHRIQTLYLEGNTKLTASIHLYKKFGFKVLEAPNVHSHYERVNLFMELQLS